MSINANDIKHVILSHIIHFAEEVTVKLQLN